MLLQTYTPSSSSQLTGEAARLWTILSDLADQLDIQQKYRILHPEYRDYELSKDMILRLESLPQEIQDRSWIYLLRSYLYGIIYNGSLRKLLASEQPKTPVLSFENDSYMGVDLQFYQQLHESNTGQGYFASGWQITHQLEDQSYKVKKGELTLTVKRDRHFMPNQPTPKVGDNIAIRMPKNLVQNGFYMAVGNAGSDRPYQDKRPETLVRIYFNLTTEGAIAIMRDLTQHLNEAQVPFSFKALYNPKEYGRHDSAVLYFSKSDFEKVHPILQTIYQHQSAHFGTEIPLFTKELAPGLGCAEETDFKFGNKESFGLNRCHIIALGLIKGISLKTLEAKRNAILNSFSELGLDWQRPYLNANSEDIYHLLQR